MQSKKVYAVFCLVCAIFGTTFLAIRVGVAAGAPPFLFAGMRFTIAGLVLAIALCSTGRASVRSLAALAPRAALLCLPYVVINFGTTFWAEQYIASSTAAQIDAAGPIASALLSAAFLGKRLKPAHGIGIALGFVGVYLIVKGGGAASGNVDMADRSLVASIVMLCGAVAFAGSSVLYKRLFDDSVDSFAVNSLNMLFGGIGLLLIAALTGQRAFPASATAWLSLAYLIVFGTLIGHNANLWLVKRAGPLFTSSWSYVSPIIATIVGAAFLGESVPISSAGGAALTLAGVYAIAKAESRDERATGLSRRLPRGR